eukprot:CAMPEP_0178428152 /NCGR_PEP_ID=MMETSP0689_2-20121128/30124_1 /TAXON_ID=160604 /ORGANISM="Amphidinium massartii, Strain CS-259" /LENGTH=69 /DNA_ID=CAMNT_0020049903 /DNA_START=61 /DNA_END=268 /DNA_ORIENTATION=+
MCANRIDKEHRIDNVSVRQPPTRRKTMYVTAGSSSSADMSNSGWRAAKIQENTSMGGNLLGRGAGGDGR